MRGSTLSRTRPLGDLQRREEYLGKEEDYEVGGRRQNMNINLLVGRRDAAHGATAHCRTPELRAPPHALEDVGRRLMAGAVGEETPCGLAQDRVALRGFALRCGGPSALLQFDNPTTEAVGLATSTPAARRAVHGCVRRLSPHDDEEHLQQRCERRELDRRHEEMEKEIGTHYDAGGSA